MTKELHRCASCGSMTFSSLCKICETNIQQKQEPSYEMENNHSFNHFDLEQFHSRATSSSGPLPYKNNRIHAFCQAMWGFATNQTHRTNDPTTAGANCGSIPRPFAPFGEINLRRGLGDLESGKRDSYPSSQHD